MIVVEKAGPIEAVKRSFQVLKKTWGEALTANFGIGFIVFLASCVASIPLFLGALALGSGMIPLGIVAIVIGIVALLFVSLISSALNSIIIGALYLYASKTADQTVRIVKQELDNSLTFQPSPSL